MQLTGLFFNFIFVYFLGKRSETSTTREVSSILDQTVEPTRDSLTLEPTLDQAIESELMTLLSSKIYENAPLFSRNPSLDSLEWAEIEDDKTPYTSCEQ